MNNTTLSTAAAGGAVGVSLVVLVQYGLSRAGVTLPADVAAALGTLISAVAHYFIVKPPTPPETPKVPS